ncbi:MAG: enterotoxin [Rhodanobacter sp.]
MNTYALLRCTRLVAAWVATLGVVAAASAASSAATLAQPDGQGTFGNAAISASWHVSARHLSDLTITDEINHVSIPVTEPFELVLDGGSTYGVDNLPLLSPPHVVKLKADPDAARLAERLPGVAMEASFGDSAGNVRINWRLVQRQGSHYLREVVTITAPRQAENISKVELLGSKANGAHVVGTVQGSPVVAEHDYFGFEFPISHSSPTSAADEIGKGVQLWVERKLPLEKGKSVTYSAVVGASRPTQLRRDFATYLERERAHPYRPFLHYQSWYDLGFSGTAAHQHQVPYTQSQALSRINTIGRELVEKRHVRMDSFVFDDGWDDYKGSWNFSKAFPHGFEPLCSVAKKYAAGLGIWLSPWGGYDQPLEERVANGRKLGYGVVDGRFALSAPKYWQRFHHVVMTLLDKDCINGFKFDGTGNVDFAYPGSKFDSDFAAAIQLINDMRADKPDTFVNLTTGTWPSPFWLRYADSIFRGGGDHGFAGVGPKREQWITYRDEQTYRNIVERGPLYPLNSLMLHAIIYAQYAVGLNTDPDDDFENEVRSFFATGADLQGLMITPSLLTPHNWDVLARAANWSRANAQVLEDTHWIGGDPGRLNVYGWAAWTPNKALITWRNPDSSAQLALLDLRKQLQLPPGADAHFSVRDLWRTGGGDVPRTLDADHMQAIKLAPFEVLTLELTPVAGGRS